MQPLVDTPSKIIVSYTESLLKPKGYQFLLLYAALLVILTAGVLSLIFMSSAFVSLILIFLGASGLYFSISGRLIEKYTIEPNLYHHKGRLSGSFVGSGKFRRYALHSGEHFFVMPDALQSFSVDLKNKHEGQDVDITSCIFQKTQNGIVKNFYVPVRIGSDFCIETAIRRHGKYIFLKDVLHSIFIFGALLGIGVTCYYFLKFTHVRFFPLVQVDLWYFISLIVSVVTPFFIVNKYLSRNPSHWDDRLKC